MNQDSSEIFGKRKMKEKKYRKVRIRYLHFSVPIWVYEDERKRNLKMREVRKKNEKGRKR